MLHRGHVSSFLRSKGVLGGKVHRFASRTSSSDNSLSKGVGRTRDIDRDAVDSLEDLKLDVLHELTHILGLEGDVNVVLGGGQESSLGGHRTEV